jgi:hypothetical protein
LRATGTYLEVAGVGAALRLGQRVELALPNRRAVVVWLWEVTSVPYTLSMMADRMRSGGGSSVSVGVGVDIVDEQLGARMCGRVRQARALCVERIARLADNNAAATAKTRPRELRCHVYNQVKGALPDATKPAQPFASLCDLPSIRCTELPNLTKREVALVMLRIVGVRNLPEQTLDLGGLRAISQQTTAHTRAHSQTSRRRCTEWWS